MAMLRTKLWVSALVRRAETAGAFAAVVRSGDPDGGDVVVKVSLLDGRARLFAPMPGLEGRVWADPRGGETPRPEADADLYLARRSEDDPDLWIVEVEDREGRSFIVD